MRAYLHTCTMRPDGAHESFLAQSVPYRHAPMAHHRRGLTWTASGYGARIPTEHMVQVHGKWRRVYCYVYSNVGTLFIGRRYDGTAIIRLDPDGKPFEPPAKLYPGRRRSRATRFIWDAADRMHASGVTVDCDSAYSTVSIDAPGKESIFMQGDDADTFIEECRKLWNRYPSLPMDVCELALAEPYTVLWG